MCPIHIFKNFFEQIWLSLTVGLEDGFEGGYLLVGVKLRSEGHGLTEPHKWLKQVSLLLSSTLMVVVKLLRLVLI